MAVINTDSTLAKVGSNLAFLRDWSTSNEETFVQVMNCLAEEKPDRWAELFLRVQDKIAAPKEQSPKVNLHINADMQKLQALATTIDPKNRIEPENQKSEYANFEELK